MPETPRLPQEAAQDQDFLSHLLTDPVEQHDLLSHLLAEPLPTREPRAAPVRLRTVREQEELAFQPFLRRTWIDRSLHYLERLLVVAAVGVFGYWFIDGPVRDWLHFQGFTTEVSAQSPAAQPTPQLTIPDTAPPAVAANLPALPFTTADMLDPPADPSSDLATVDFLAPQSIPVQPLQRDPRPNRLLLPSIGVDSGVVEVYVENGAWQVADYAVGYHHGTALPGMIGNMVMAGHAGLRGAVFRDLGDLTLGDEVIVETAGWRYRYRVSEMRNVWPTQVEVMAPSNTPTLTLITCTNWDTQRLIVVADLVDVQPLS